MTTTSGTGKITNVMVVYSSALLIELFMFGVYQGLLIIAPFCLVLNFGLLDIS